MKRNKQSTRAMRQRTTAETKARGTSKYALKVKGGKQMYGSKHVAPTDLDAAVKAASNLTQAQLADAAKNTVS